MTLERTPAVGASARIWSSRPRKLSGSPKRRIRRSTVALACWKERSKYGTTPGVLAIASTRPGPGLGGLEVGDPDPLDPVDGGQLGQQRLEEPQVAEVLAVRRGVLPDQEELADALARQPAAPPRARRRAGG